MTGKILSVLLVASALIAGVAMYYLQVYGFYEEVTPRPGADVMLVPDGGVTPEPIAYANFRAIDADSSPIRFRACFTTSERPEALAEQYMAATTHDPRNAPGWFDCFNAASIGAALKSGAARAFIGEKNIEFGVDRIVAVTNDGHGYIWHELNNCGEKAYDGTIVGEECPSREDANK